MGINLFVPPQCQPTPKRNKAYYKRLLTIIELPFGKLTVTMEYHHFQ